MKSTRSTFFRFAGSMDGVAAISALSQKLFTLPAAQKEEVWQTTGRSTSRLTSGHVGNIVQASVLQRVDDVEA